MIKDKTIIFGCGTVAVGSALRYITFQELRPPEICGTPLERCKANLVGKEISIPINYHDYVEYTMKLHKVNTNQGGTFEFKGYVFDFTNYNSISVDVCKMHAEVALCNYTRIAAV